MKLYCKQAPHALSERRTVFVPTALLLLVQFLKDVDWGDLDFLIVDAPPGTSDEHISVAQVCACSAVCAAT